MIRHCTEQDIEAICEIINDAAIAYKGIIPEDRWHEPYMPLEELKGEIEDGVKFWGFEDQGRLLGVMGIQDKGEVHLIRHAYVRPESQGRRGIPALSALPVSKDSEAFRAPQDRRATEVPLVLPALQVPPALLAPPVLQAPLV